MKNTIYRHRLVLGTAIIVLAFLSGHSLFFFTLPLPGFYNDFISYLEVAEKIKLGHLPISDWVPLGYPIFLWLVSVIQNSSFAIIIAQCMLLLCSTFFLLAVINKYYPVITLPCAIALGFFLLSVNTIDFSTALLTESLYVSFSLIACGFTLHALSNPFKSSSWAIVAASYIALMLVRPAGLVFFGFLPLFLIFFAWIKAPAKNYYYFTGTWVALVLLWMSYNYLTLGIFNIGYPAQFSPQPIKKKEFQIQYEQGLEVPEGRSDNFWRYFRNFSDQRTFYSVLSDRHQRMYDSTDTYLYLGFHEKYKEDCFTFLPGINIDSMVYKEYYPKPVELDRQFYNMTGSRFFKLYDIFYLKIGNPLLKNVFWVILFFASGALGLYSFFFDKDKRPLSCAILFIFSLNLSAGLLFLLTVSMNPNVRYSYPMQFCYYLILPFTWLLVHTYWEKKPCKVITGDGFL